MNAQELIREIAEKHGLVNFVYDRDDAGVLTTREKAMAAIEEGYQAGRASVLQPAPAQATEQTEQIEAKCEFCGGLIVWVNQQWEHVSTEMRHEVIPIPKWSTGAALPQAAPEEER